MATDRIFDCPGLSMLQPPDAPPEGYVACYRGGHQCTSTTTEVENEAGREVTVHCPCCGSLYAASFTPWSLLREWEAERRREAGEPHRAEVSP